MILNFALFVAALVGVPLIVFQAMVLASAFGRSLGGTFMIGSGRATRRFAVHILPGDSSATALTRRSIEETRYPRNLIEVVENSQQWRDPSAWEGDAVVVLAAGSSVSPGLFEEFGRALDNGAEWVQAYCVADGEGDDSGAMAAYAGGLHFGVWQMGSEALGLGAMFIGTGMCLTRTGLVTVPWTEAMDDTGYEYSWRLRARGARVTFVTGVVVRAIASGDSVLGEAGSRRREAARMASRRGLWDEIRTSVGIGMARRAALLVDIVAPRMRQWTACLAGMALASFVLIFVGDMTGVLWQAAVAIQALAWMTLAVLFVSPFVLMGLPTRLGPSVAREAARRVWR